ncbi:MAG TPA: HAMP domain-containing sensor histidine kinase [Verrucomicrobiales bacterium]|jgi:signal transduction histidine kinase|nr:HAMP domain-containing sensor histidine kinase [Verrucomicrobiales bacterium]
MPLPLSPRSLQNRLLLSFLVWTTGILVAGGFVIYSVMGKYLADENDHFLEDRLNFYETTLKLDYFRKTNQPAAISLLSMPEWERISKTENPDMVKVWYAADGKFLTRSPSLVVSEKEATPDIANQPRDPPRPEVHGTQALFKNYTAWDGRPARMISRQYVPDKTDPRIPDIYMQIFVGRDLLTLEATLSKVRWFLVKIGLTVMGAALVASRFIIRRGVRPVKSLADQIEVMPLTTEAGERFGLPGAPTELQPVVGRLNALMDRVGVAIEHERQFASNAAHELRNPLAAIRSTIEVALSRNRKGEEYEEALESIWQSQQGMQRVVDHLLLLARLESGHGRHEFPSEPAVLGRMLKKSWRNCIDVAEEKKLRVAWQVEDPEAEIMVVISLLDIVFTNLLENAVNYTPAGGEVRIHAAVREGICGVAVENTNPGLTPQVLEDTFAPFWRADPNASGHRGNAGIGLALCRRIAITLGGRISASLTAENMVRYLAEFPVSLASESATKRLVSSVQPVNVQA